MNEGDTTVTLRTSSAVSVSVERYNELIKHEKERVIEIGKKLRAYQCLSSLCGGDAKNFNLLEPMLDQPNYGGLAKGIAIVISEADKDWVIPAAHRQNLTLGGYMQTIFDDWLDSHRGQIIVSEYEKSGIATHVPPAAIQPNAGSAGQGRGGRAMTEREQFEKWLGEETCEVHCDESANKNAWYGWQAGRQQGLEQIEQVERMADDLAAEIYIQGGSSSLYWQSREVADAIRKLKEQG